MKTKLLISIISVILFSVKGYSQIDDSIRTRNDKPGTPQSLRKSDQSPESHVTIINTKTAPNQTIIHTAPESSTTNNTNGKSTVTTTHGNTSIPKTPITLQNKPLVPADIIKKNPPGNVVPKTGNPIRNN